MKFVKYILPVALLTLGSCAKDYLDTAPTHGLGANRVSSTRGAEDALVDGVHNLIYNSYSGEQTYGYGQQHYNMLLDMLSDDMINTRPSLFMPVYRWNDHRSDKGALNEFIWKYYYKILLNINTALPIVGEGRDNLKAAEKRRLGELYALRAWAYHNLVQLFGKRYTPGTENKQLGVVLRTEASYDPQERATVGEVYAQIDADLKKALDYLKGQESIGKNHINYATAAGLAARVALSKHAWADAERYAEEAISNSKARLQSGTALVDGFNNWEASEWIWAYKQNQEQNHYFSGFGASFSYNFSGYNRQLRISVNRKIYDRTNPTDVRRNWFVCKDLNNAIPRDANPGYFNPDARSIWEVSGQSIKYKTHSQDKTFMDILLLRLGELYYIQAEAEARQGKDAEAQNTLYTVMSTRDESYTKSTATGATLIEEVMDNKRLDLWGEGQRFYDMKRLGIVPKRTEAPNFQIVKNLLGEVGYNTAIARNSGGLASNIATSVDDIRWEFLIPNKEIEASQKKIVQNPTE